jgi:hypothetical protein
VLAPWPSVEELAAAAPLPEGYRYELLSRRRIPELVDFLYACYPGIEVGNASCHLREDFYASRASLGGEGDGDFFVVLFMHGEELAGMHSTERDLDSEVLYGRIGAIAPAHRGRGLAISFLGMMEALGRAVGAGMVYGLATLNTRRCSAASSIGAGSSSASCPASIASWWLPASSSACTSRFT